MAETENGSISKRAAETDEISLAIVRAGRQAVIEHALLGRSVPFSINGKVVWVAPEEILARFKNNHNEPTNSDINKQ
jgi:hypothetical protein